MYRVCGLFNVYGLYCTVLSVFVYYELVLHTFLFFLSAVVSINHLSLCIAGIRLKSFLTRNIKKKNTYSVRSHEFFLFKFSLIPSTRFLWGSNIPLFDGQFVLVHHFYNLNFNEQCLTPLNL